MKVKQKNKAKATEKRIYEKWQSWAVLISAIVGLLGSIAILPQKFITAYKIIFPRTKSCQFYGRIIDSNNNPVIGAEVIVHGKKGTGLTDDNGEFNFKVKEQAGARIQVFIKKDGRIKYNGIETLPGPAIIKLKDEP